MPADLSTEEPRHAYPMAMVIISATEGSVERTVNCMCTPSDSANLHRTRTSAPPRNTPGKTWRPKTNKSLQQSLFHHGQRTNTPLVLFSMETLQFLFYPSLACLHWSGLVRLTFVVTPSRSSSPRPHLIELTTPTARIIKTTSLIIIISHPKVPFCASLRLHMKSETCRLHVKQRSIFFARCISLGSCVALALHEIHVLIHPSVHSQRPLHRYLPSRVSFAYQTIVKWLLYDRESNH